MKGGKDDKGGEEHCGHARLSIVGDDSPQRKGEGHHAGGD